jgi:hypothetical protein
MSAARRLFILLVLVTLVLPAYGARKRRAAAAPGGGGGNHGQCHTFGFVRAGLKASYLSTTSNGSATYTITYLEDTATRARTTQQVQTPQGMANVATTIDVETVGILRGMRKAKLDTTINVPGFGDLTTTITIDFVPSLIMGPAEGWCVGKTWAIPPVTETITTTLPVGGNQTQIVTTVASEGQVLAVGDEVEVPAGEYLTVKYKNLTLANNTLQPTITWVSMEHNVVVKQDTLDANGNVTTTTVLTNLQ